MSFDSDDIIRPQSGLSSDSIFFESYQERKARRADEVRRLARQARQQRTSDTYLARLEADQQDIRDRRALAERVEAEAKAIDLAQALQAVDIAAQRTPHAVHRVILRETANKHGLAVVDITGRSRKHKVVLARQEAAWRMRAETTLSSPEIGRRLGGRDHTTVLHSVRKHQARRDAEGGSA